MDLSRLAQQLRYTRLRSDVAAWHLARKTFECLPDYPVNIGHLRSSFRD